MSTNKDKIIDITMLLDNLNSMFSFIETSLTLYQKIEIKTFLKYILHLVIKPVIIMVKISPLNIKDDVLPGVLTFFGCTVYVPKS